MREIERQERANQPKQKIEYIFDVTKILGLFFHFKKEREKKEKREREGKRKGKRKGERRKRREREGERISIKNEGNRKARKSKSAEAKD